MLGSIIRVNTKYYYLQALLEESKYETKKKKMEDINNDLDPILSDNETDSDSGNEADNEIANGSNSEQ